MTATTLSDAAKECSDNPNCHMFFDHEVHANSFYACEKAATIDESSSNSTLHQHHGNKPHIQA